MYLDSIDRAQLYGKSEEMNPEKNCDPKVTNQDMEKKENVNG